MLDDQISVSEIPSNSAVSKIPDRPSGSDTIVCPVCGAIAIQEKCKVICRSEICRGRIVMNCSEF
jgi:hypothetical protein